MIYGNVFLPKKEESISMMEFGIESVVYNEYHNYKSLLEACTDKSSRPILEAQVQVLYEISFKDIIGNIVKGINTLINKIKELLLFIKNKFSEARLAIIEKRIKKLEAKRNKIIGLSLDFDDEEFIDVDDLVEIYDDDIECEIYDDLYEKGGENSSLKFNEDKFKEIEEKNKELAEELVKAKAKISSDKQLSEENEKKLSSAINKITRIENIVTKVASNPRLYFYATDFINENIQARTFTIHLLGEYFRSSKTVAGRQELNNAAAKNGLSLDLLIDDLKRDIDKISIFNDNALKNVFKCEKDKIPTQDGFGWAIDDYLETKIPKGKIKLKDFIHKLSLYAKNTNTFAKIAYDSNRDIENALNYLKHIISSEFKMSEYDINNLEKGLEKGTIKITNKESIQAILITYHKLSDMQLQLEKLIHYCNKCSGLQEGALSVLEPIYGILNDNN